MNFRISYNLRVQERFARPKPEHTQTPPSAPFDVHVDIAHVNAAKVQGWHRVHTLGHVRPLLEPEHTLLKLDLLTASQPKLYIPMNPEKIRASLSPPLLTGFKKEKGGRAQKAWDSLSTNLISPTTVAWCSWGVFPFCLLLRV